MYPYNGQPPYHFYQQPVNPPYQQFQQPFHQPLQPPYYSPPYYQQPYPPYQHYPGGPTFLHQFKKQNGNYDMPKMMNSASQMINTVQQFSPMVKQMGSLLNLFIK
ncbi:YppG family protein [Pseudalkalibacillus hwajinpoensis]|uniref:YppG family protein n=1 Tax=Guptibacillus hwajinpoensis TaxID=208199 RepID=UPI00325ABBD1